jgi:hypothetical protein
LLGGKGAATRFTDGKNLSPPQGKTVHERATLIAASGEPKSILGRLQNEARGLVLRLRAPIARLADELLSRTTLIWPEVEAVVGPMIPMR